MATINEGMRATAVSVAQILEEAHNLQTLSDDLSSEARNYRI